MQKDRQSVGGMYTISPRDKRQDGQVILDAYRQIQFELLSYKEEVKRLTNKMNSPVRGVGKFSLTKVKKPTTVAGSIDQAWVSKNSIQGTSYTEKSVQMPLPTISIDAGDNFLLEAKEQVAELQSENGRLKSLLERLRGEMKDNLDS